MLRLLFKGLEQLDVVHITQTAKPTGPAVGLIGIQPVKTQAMHQLAATRP